jgi:hypothetical protein
MDPVIGCAAGPCGLHGDLLEQSSTRGMRWFWSNVLRAACSHFWCDLAACPLRTLWLAFWGWLASLVIPTLVILSLGNVIGAFPLWAVYLMVWAVRLAVGWNIARRSHRRELAAIFWVALLMAAWAVLLFNAPPPLTGAPVVTRSLPEHPIASLFAYTLNMAAGAILYRRHAIKGGEPCVAPLQRNGFYRS